MSELRKPCSTVILTTVLLVAYGAIFFGISGQQIYFIHGLTSFLSNTTTLFPVTFGSYMIFMGALAYVLSLSVAFIAFIISRFSRNLLTALFKAVPAYVALSFLWPLIFGEAGDSTNRPFTLWNPLYRLVRILGIEAIALLALMLIGLAVTLWMFKRERRLDV